MLQKESLFELTNKVLETGVNKMQQSVIVDNVLSNPIILFIIFITFIIVAHGLADLIAMIYRYMVDSMAENHSCTADGYYNSLNEECKQCGGCYADVGPLSNGKCQGCNDPDLPRNNK